jgi:hypothetical protein
MASVPDVVIGTPDTDNNDGTVADTLVTVPVLFVYPLGLDAEYAPKLVNAAIAVVALVPPLAIGNGVPEYVRAIVPDVVIGTPDTDNSEGTVAFTLVTVPAPYPLGLDAGYAPKLVNAAIAVVALVPPLAIPSVPDSVTMPDVVTGPPDVVNPVVPPDTSIDVTVPVLLVYPFGLDAG